MHRGTGIALAFGTFLLVWWLCSIAHSETAFSNVQAFMASWLGRLMLLAWSYALFYHLCNGIRHLFWDVGKGFQLDIAYRNGWLVVGASIILTLIAWVWGYVSMGVLG
tara:strand:+ start:291 stop:614 length:324 start_codon:yes stop_codon:yes gene_type:complete